MNPDLLQASLPNLLPGLLRRIESRYPDWTGINDPRFAHDELGYKRAAAAQAAELLGAEVLGTLLAEGQFDEILKRVRRLASATNLLFMGVPRVGDLSLLNQGLDTAEICTALFDLLHGSGKSPERLGRFINFVEAVGATPKWALPTYLLFLLHPTSDIFVKPAGFQAFLNVLGRPELWSTIPSADSYAALLRLCNDVRQIFEPYGAQDMIDVQSLIWVVAQTTKPPRRKKGQAAVAGTNSEVDTAPSSTKTRRLREAAGSYTTSKPQPAPAYTPAHCAADIGLGTDTLQTWLQGIARKRQAILYGPPGTGKTFAAHKLAQYLLAASAPNSDKPDGFIELVQFHPAYAYEDFVQGIRPMTNPKGKLTYPLVDGRFLVFCKAAAAHRGPCVLIVDEINRADLARVFGELMYLLEYRDEVITLASGQPFSIPTNVILLGTMNTADRSIALVDHALRRRFAFLPMPPNYALLRQFHASQDPAAEPLISALIDVLIRLNEEIADPQYALGTSFFLQRHLPDQLESIWRTEIEPYLEEYFFDQPARVDAFRWERIANAFGPV